LNGNKIGDAGAAALAKALPASKLTWLECVRAARPGRRRRRARWRAGACCCCCCCCCYC
jgi:hypothetical protein